ncbi:hypothetical protein FIBSPDRAFT_900065 [Athelia psychrophila]|uniref:Uncharacterized protein n=1 Tax=Athelia psychrophila TaxID=1759441 RepID=A0A165YXA6_9AGAM|nr:hypothetical protein FIBSPDRAFT_900065 [Fibularhizoctonia sp. CBS 109695]
MNTHWPNTEISSDSRLHGYVLELPENFDDLHHSMCPSLSLAGRSAERDARAENPKIGKGKPCARWQARRRYLLRPGPGLGLGLGITFRDIVEMRRLHGKGERSQGGGMGDVQCLVFIFDLHLRFNDRDGQGQSYGFGVGTTMPATLVITVKVKHDHRDWRNIATMKDSEIAWPAYHSAVHGPSESSVQRHNIRPIHHRARGDRRPNSIEAPGVVMASCTPKRLESEADSGRLWSSQVPLIRQGKAEDQMGKNLEDSCRLSCWAYGPLILHKVKAFDSTTLALHADALEPMFAGIYDITKL